MCIHRMTEMCAAHNICSYALNPAKLNPSSRNAGTSHAQFQPLCHVCSSQPEEAVTVKGIFLLSVNIFLISRFIQIWIYCLLQLWKPVFPQAGYNPCPITNDLHSSVLLLFPFPIPNPLPPLLSSEHLLFITLFPKSRVAESLEKILCKILKACFSFSATSSWAYSETDEWSFGLTHHVYSQVIELCVSSLLTKGLFGLQ